MLNTYTYPEFAYRPSPEQQAGEVKRHPVVIIGAGPIGMTQALDLAARGVASVILDDNNTVSIGSRAVCYAKRPLEIWDRLGLGEGYAARGIQWKVGKVFFRNDLAYQFDLLPEEHHKMPAMINLQQYYLEEELVKACDASPLVDLRWKHKLLALEQGDSEGEGQGDGVATLTVETPDGIFKMQAEWVIAADGANSDTRRMVGADFTGHFFQDRFLIADVVISKTEFPTERWFWFDPPFHRNQSVLLHKECDNVWRIDFQLGWDADPEEEKKPENIIPRVQALLGKDTEFTLEWASVYTFACLRMDSFVHGRVLFAGDCAHGVSPFGARGANSGVQDTDNLAWKLDWVLKGRAGTELLATYGPEREYAADENLLNSTRATDFITPKSEISRLFRDAALDLAREHPFARRIVNSGRLSVPAVLHPSPLNTPDADSFAGTQVPGAVLLDAPVRRNGHSGWLLRQLGMDFTLLVFGPVPAWAQGLPHVQALSIGQDIEDVQGLVAQRLDGQSGTAYLIRPDQHVCARWRTPTEAAVRAALATATVAATA